jgi:hypothetical protein
VGLKKGKGKPSDVKVGLSPTSSPFLPTCGASRPRSTVARVVLRSGSGLGRRRRLAGLLGLCLLRLGEHGPGRLKDGAGKLPLCGEQPGGDLESVLRRQRSGPGRRTGRENARNRGRILKRPCNADKSQLRHLELGDYFRRWPKLVCVGHGGKGA